MLKLIYCLRRLPNLSRAEFQRYWLETHGPLVRSHADALRIHRYVQSHTAHDDLNEALRANRGGDHEPFDGVAELWWESRAEFEAAIASPEGMAASLALFEDERRFIDHAHSPVFVSQEHPIIAA